MTWEIRLWRLKSPFLKVRRVRGWTQEQAAKKAEVCYATYKNWEWGRHRPRVSLMMPFLLAARRAPVKFLMEVEEWWSLRPKMSTK